MKLYKFPFILLLTIIACSTYGRQTDTTFHILQQPLGKYYAQINKKLRSINKKLTSKSEKYLTKLKKQENHLHQKIEGIDSSASTYFDGISQKYEEQIKQLRDKRDSATTITSSQYSSYLDTLSTSLKFLKGLGNTSKGEISLKELNTLQSKFQSSEKIKEYIAGRKQQVKELLSKYTKLPKRITKGFTRLNKTAYYYSAQVNEYKDILKDPTKAERKALSLLNKLPVFQKFFQKNSQLASLFGMPDNYGTAQSLAGLQTRTSVRGLIQQQVSVGGPNVQQILQQNLAKAHGELDKLKGKINKFGGGSSDIDMPDFKPNTQKTKNILQRLEHGADVQFVKSDKVLPSTTNIGLNLGYKLNDKSIIGIGMSYKMGMGTIRHIIISHEGIGLRSFIGYKISPLRKQGLFISGGYEMNYNTRFKKIEQLKNLSTWQSSGLIGLSKKCKVSKKVNAEMKLLYDFLANEHRPVTHQVVLRLGYQF